MKAVDALLSGLVDYAGLFPPASDGMREAVENYAQYRDGEDHRALGRFIVPVARLQEFSDVARDLLPRGSGSEPWRLSVLVAGDVSAAGEQLLEFNRRHSPDSMDGHAVVDVIELKAGTADEVERQRAELPGGFIAYFEIPIGGNVSPLVKAVALAGARAKVRTGGVTADSIPPAGEILDFIVACRNEAVPFKATAGLHHPIRGEYRLTYEPNSPVGMMYGFLNVFIASVLVNEGERRDVALAALEESDPHAFAFEDEAIVWRGKRITAGQIEASRRMLGISFGSCSFREPVDELAPLTLTTFPDSH
ncbi:MAG TPA: hypothetical protein VD771_02115 [Gemmatimonadaceae bacterium]|nr:hypothetical protein [Gemmatimonadaceae bacterium]